MNSETRNYFLFFPQITPSKKNQLEHFDRLNPPYLALHFALFALREPLRDCLCRSVRVSAFIFDPVAADEERGRRRRRKPPPSPAPLSASRLFTEGGGKEGKNSRGKYTRSAPSSDLGSNRSRAATSRAPFRPGGLGRRRERAYAATHLLTHGLTDGTPAGV